MRALLFVTFFLLASCLSTSGPKHFTVELEGAEIAGERSGEGDPVLVFLHGWCCDRTQWRGVIELLEDEHECLALDLPGHGDSGPGPVSVSRLGGVVAETIRSATERPVVLVGHSLGGPIALSAANKLGTQVTRLIAVESLHDVDHRYSDQEVDSIKRSLVENFPLNMRAFCESGVGTQASPAVLEAVTSAALAVEPQTAIGILDALRGQRPAVYLARITQPVLLINTQHMAPTRMSSNRRFHRKIELRQLEGLGHFPHVEAPERVAEEIRRWLAPTGDE